VFSSISIGICGAFCFNTGNHAAVAGIDEQIDESKVHAQQFKATLEKAAKRFAALAKVEEKHANNYRNTLAKVNA
jgi:rubrerythrin